MKKWNKPEIIEVTKKEVTAKVESLCVRKPKKSSGKS